MMVVTIFLFVLFNSSRHFTVHFVFNDPYATTLLIWKIKLPHKTFNGNCIYYLVLVFLQMSILLAVASAIHQKLKWRNEFRLNSMYLWLDHLFGGFITNEFMIFWITDNKVEFYSLIFDSQDRVQARSWNIRAANGPIRCKRSRSKDDELRWISKNQSKWK